MDLWRTSFTFEIVEEMTKNNFVKYYIQIVIVYKKIWTRIVFGEENSTLQV